jgi:FAD/FMN-containing dehydrogenase
MPSSLPDTARLDDLRAGLAGRVIGPGDADYDTARSVFYGGFDRHPAVIVRAANATDVARVIEMARTTGLPLAVRSGGHSNAGHGTVEGGLVLDLGAMKALDLDVAGRTAWAEPGLTAIEYTTAAAAHGLATGFGDTGSVGLGGITLGGGVGYLVRKHGLTIDDLLAAEIVTADGRLRRIDADSEPDLFWAIRGGGGNFGVATRFQFRLHPLPAIVGGMLMLPATPAVLAGFIAAAEAAPEALSTIANVMPAPPMPFVPPEQHGQPVIFGMLCYAGEAEAGQRAVAPFRALAAPIVDMVQPTTYPAMYPPEDDRYHPVGVVHSMFLDGFDEAAAGLILERLMASTAMMAVAQLRVLGGAMARVPAEATAFAHRGRRILANLAALYQPPDDGGVHQAWLDGFAAAVGPSAAGVYVNFLAEEGAARVREAYPDATWERLRTIKGRYDPDNLFRINQNIPPADRG